MFTHRRLPNDGNPAEDTTHTEPFPFRLDGLHPHFRVPWDFSVKGSLQFRQMRCPDLFRHFKQNNGEPLYLDSFLQDEHFFGCRRF
jgi:hypothetical protein